MKMTHITMQIIEIDLVNEAAQGDLDAFNRLVLKKSRPGVPACALNIER